ncbi:MAG: hypothetical protein ACT4P5_16630 [Armatimonadota bacterium]
MSEERGSSRLQGRPDFLGKSKGPIALMVCRAPGQRGFVLVAVLVILFAITASSASFVWFMQQTLTRSGARYRSAAAMAIAEGGIHRALSALEGPSPDGRKRGRFWRPAAYSESMRIGPLEGRFTVSIVDDSGGTIAITSVGEVAGVARRLRAHVHLTSPALLVSLNGASVIRLEKPPTATFSFPYGAALRDRPWIDLAAGRAIWLATSDVSVNRPFTDIVTGPGPRDAPARAPDLLPPRQPMPVRLAMPLGGHLMLDPGQQHVDIQQLRSMGVQVRGDILRSEALARFPEVDRSFYETLAAANIANAHLNRAAGQYVGDGELARKPDSLYSEREFEQLQTYLAAGFVPARFTGIVYVRGRTTLFQGQQMRIADGALVVEGAVVASPMSSLEITHSTTTRTLPGIITLDYGPVVVARGARLRVHGLVYASRTIFIGDGAHVDIVGSVLGKDQDLSFRNSSGIFVIRYDPAVLGTPGLRVPIDAPVVAWVSAWEELP